MPRSLVTKVELEELVRDYFEAIPTGATAEDFVCFAITVMNAKIGKVVEKLITEYLEAYIE